MWIKSNDNVILKFKMEYNDEGNVEGRIQTFKINDDGEPEPFDLRIMLGDDVNNEELTDEGPSEGTLMN